MSKGIDFESFLVEISLRREKVESFDRYPFTIPAVRQLETLPLHPKVTYFIGENGSGKSTLVEAIAVGLGINAEGGSKNFRFSTRESHSILSTALRLSRSPRKPKDLYFLRAESFFNVATDIERMDKEPCFSAPVITYYGNKSLHEQSHGESFFALFNKRFYGNGLYLLDEPEAALSPQRQLSFLARMHQLLQKNSQFIISTHSPILLAYPDAWIYELSSSGTKKVSYEASEPYTITKEFLNRRDKMLELLFQNDDTES